MAKKTLVALYLPALSKEIRNSVQGRITILQELEAELVYFLEEHKEAMPFVPSERCRAIVTWFVAQKVSNPMDEELLMQKLQLGDNLVRSESSHILADKNLPIKIDKALTNFLEGLSEYSQGLKVPPKESKRIMD